jgi:cytochrome c oxidase subunit 2
MRRVTRWAVRATPWLLGALLLASCGPDNGQNSLDPKAPQAQEIDDLFDPVVWIAVVVFVIVTMILFVAVFKFRARPNSEEPVQVHGNTPIEIGWTLIPLIILGVVAIFSIRLIFVQAEAASADALEVKVVGKQWWWQFEYPKQPGIDKQVVTMNFTFRKIATLFLTSVRVKAKAQRKHAM